MQFAAEASKLGFFQQAEPVERVGLVLMTADRGLCGSFNVNLINTAVKFIRGKEAEGKEISLICVGRKGRDFFRRRKREMLAQYVDVWNKFDFSNAVTVSREIMSAFLTGGVQEVHLIHANFVNMAIQRPKLVQLLPIKPGEAEHMEIPPMTGTSPWCVFLPPGLSTSPMATASGLSASSNVTETRNAAIEQEIDVTA